MKLLGWLAATVFFAAGPANAQPGMAAAETVRARMLLDSPNPAERAWGAYFAARLHDDSFLEPLISQLRLQIPFAGAAPDYETPAYIRTLLDALIELGRPVPADAVLPFESQWRAETLILLARDPANGDELLKMRKEELTDVEWLAVNNLLLRFRLPALFAITLQELKITHRFAIVDPQNGIGFGGSKGCGGGASVSTGRVPVGFPPVGVYSLEDGGAQSVQFGSAEDALSGDVLLAPGPHNIYYKRTVAPAGSEGRIAAPGPQAPDRQQFLLEYIERLCQLTAENGAELFHPMTTIAWQNAADCARAIEAALDRQATNIARLLAAEKQMGRVNLDGIQLEIAPTVQDFRRNASDALPIVGPRAIPLN
jgi:hypothetical protein